MPNDNFEQITINNHDDRGGSHWQPTIGQETQMLLSHLALAPESQQRLVDETTQILARCGDPSHEHSNDIGLVFGYVQSGKTMSFTTLTALAKDNGYKIIIIIAGISTNLVEQSFTRLERDLRIDSRGDLQWLSFRNARETDATTRQQMATALAGHIDPTFPAEERKTILITVMKQKNHLLNLRELLETLDLRQAPTLIIDDEGDQHSMNTRARRNARTGRAETSTIYQRIIELREAIPHHTFIQYTATPQAPLFIDIMDNLSPNFIQLLTPGPGYTGGRSFFLERPELTQIIDDIDPEADTPPESLIYAMQIFFLGVVKGGPRREGKKRSMMIHPSQLTYTHADYFRFAIAIKNRFVETLARPETDPDRQELLEQFQEAYQDLAATAPDIPPFSELTGDRLRHAITGTVVQSLNSRDGNKTIVNWRNNYSFILIGGQAMDRGFTVEGLTVTYMPRSVGIGNVDTIQQRARFFGYKQSYLGYCRVYLDEDARDSYINYVAHEEDMRRRLAHHRQSGESLNSWYREVFLSADLSLARSNIFSHELERTIFGGEWTTPKIPHHTQRMIENNQQIGSSFLNTLQVNRVGRFPRSEVRLSDVYNEFLNMLRFTSPEDASDYTALLYILSKHLENTPEETCTIFLMSEGAPRERTLTADNKINQLFQGRNSNYSGDREMRGDGITFQIHTLNLLKEGQVVFRDIFTIATFIPEEIGKDLIRWAE